ncbi:MAG: DUF3426 domain-containing protein [Granulosicoccus sp.]|nr:DUF3426 domain-containing protein [Granulosicoccus sp.]
MGKPSQQSRFASSTVRSNHPDRKGAAGASASVSRSSSSGRRDVARPGAGDDYLNPQTCCSNCQTIFEVSLELLSSSDTRVRCGECLSIFDALANLRDNDSVEEDFLLDQHGNVMDPDRGSRHGAGHGYDSAAGTGRILRGTGGPGLDDSDSHHDASSLTDASAAALAGLANDTSPLDVTYSDFELFSADAGLPDVAYFDQTRETPPFDFDELTDEQDDETFNDSLFAQDVTVDARSALTGAANANDTYDLQNIALDSDVDYIADDAPREPLIFNYRERETRSPGQAPGIGPTRARSFNGRTETHHASGLPNSTPDGTLNPGRIEPPISVADVPAGSWWFRSLLFLVLLLLAAGLYGYRERSALQHNPYLRPLLESACSLLDCTLAEQVDLASLKILRRSVFSHPTLDDVLIITIGFVNESTFSQPYPILEIRLTDRNGRLVVKNNFKPAEYLESWQEGDVLDAGKRLDISLNVEDPGSTAMSFELDFH